MASGILVASADRTTLFPWGIQSGCADGKRTRVSSLSSAIVDVAAAPSAAPTSDVAFAAPAVTIDLLAPVSTPSPVCATEVEVTAPSIGD